MRSARLLLPAVVFVVVAQSGASGEVVSPADAPITAVTVYPDGAGVERRIPVEPQTDDWTVELAGLTADLDPESVRAAASEDLAIALVDVDKTFLLEASQGEARGLTARIDRLEAERAAQQDRVRAAERQLELVGQLIARAGTPGDDTENDAPTPADHWREMLALVGEESAAAYDRQREAGREIARIDTALDKARSELAELRGGRTESYTVTIALAAAEPTPADITLSYRVHEAGWRPLYDARLDTAAGRLELAQLAEVTQSTGEDWKGVRLSLATTRPHAAGPLPRLESWFIDLRRERTAAEEPLARPDMAPAAGLAAPQPAPVPQADLAAGEFSATYRVPGRVRVPADGSAKKVRLDLHELDVNLRGKVIPSVAPVAHLVGDLSHDGEAPLLPGAMAIYRDGAFVGRQELDLLRPGETRELSFGADDRVAVDHRLASGERGSGGFIRTEESERRLYRTEITNHHGRELEITVLDRMPVPRHEDLSIELLPETTPPTAENVDDREGVLAWRHTYAPGETRTIEFGYVVRFPEGRRLTDF